MKRQMLLWALVALLLAVPGGDGDAVPVPGPVAPAERGAAAGAENGQRGGGPAVAPPFPAAAACYQAGMARYYGQDYAGAVTQLGHCLSLYPGAPGAAAALYHLGKGYQALQSPRPALGIFGRVVERHPRSLEALWSIVAMADLGLADPGLKFPPFQGAFAHLRDPLGAYDAVLAQRIPRAMAAEVLLRKGRALQRLQRHEEVCDTFARVLETATGKEVRREAAAAIRTALAARIDGALTAGDPLSAVSVYLQALKRGFVGEDDLEMTLRYAVALARLGSVREARTVAEAVRAKDRGPLVPQLDQLAAEMAAAEKGRADGPAPSPAWSLLQTGRDHLAADQVRLAEQTLGQLKGEDGDGFWGRVVDYLLSERVWRERYRRYVSGGGKP